MDKKIQPGGDPRNYFEFSEIRQEINKLNHPAAPEVDFNRIENLALELFNKNGADLQTAAYLTFAKTKLRGAEGFLEGCELIATLVANSWSRLWPESELAKVDTLDWLDIRVGPDIRQFPFQTKQIPLLIQIEQSLKAIAERLKAEKLKKTPKIIDLYEYTKNTRATLEKRLIEQRAAKKAKPVKKQEEQLVYRPQTAVIEKRPVTVDVEKVTLPIVNKQPIIIHKTAKFKGWHGFVLGVIATSAAFLGLNHYENNIQRPEKVNLSFFTPLSTVEIGHLSLRQNSLNLNYDAPQLTDYSQQLQQLASLSPLATRYYGDNLVNLSRILWPDSQLQQQTTTAWQKQLDIESNDRFMRDGYYNAQTQLKNLANELSRAEEQKRSFTISQLKSSVYAIQTSLNQEPPLEELLRQLSVQQNPSPALIKNIDERFNSLLSYYYSLSKAPTQ